MSRARGTSTEAPSGRLEERLAARNDLTPAECEVAAVLEAERHRLPFASLASLAEAAKVSEMTVLRFLRSLGYANLKALKAALMADGQADDQIVDGTLDDRWQRFRVPAGSDADSAASLRAEIAALVQVYELAARPVWARALETVAEASLVHVTGFQASKGLALDFATRLKYARSGVRFAEGVSGTYSEIFGEDEGASCVVLVDTAAYAKTSFRLAERCAAQDIPLVVVTDRFSNWARGYTPLVLPVSTHVGTFWDATSGLSCLLNLFLNALTARLGTEAELRVGEMRELGTHFDAFGYEPARPPAALDHASRGTS